MKNDSSRAILLGVVLNYPTVVHGFTAGCFLDGGHVFCPCGCRGQMWAMISRTAYIWKVVFWPHATAHLDLARRVGYTLLRCSDEALVDVTLYHGENRVEFLPSSQFAIVSIVVWSSDPVTLLFWTSCRVSRIWFDSGYMFMCLSPETLWITSPFGGRFSSDSKTCKRRPRRSGRCLYERKTGEGFHNWHPSAR